MPRVAASGTKGLLKNHTRDCRRPADPAKCDCAWSGRHRGTQIVLAVWCGKAVDPRSKDEAKKVLRRFQAAVDDDTFDPAGEHEAAGTEQTLRLFIAEWTTHIAQARHLNMRGLGSMLSVIAKGRLGSMRLERLGGKGAVEDVEKWLNVTGEHRKWSDKTWNNYREVLGRVLRQAVRWDRLAENPIERVDARTAVQPEHFKQRILVEEVEAKLFDVVDQLNRLRPRSTRGKLTQEQADAIRAAVAAGEQGKAVAARFQVSPAVVSAIKHGDIWRGDDPVMGTKGTEMRRRLVGAFDGGLRAGEMLKVQLQHVTWRPVPVRDAHGEVVAQGYILVLPPSVTKGGKTTGKPQEVFAFTPRFVALLEARRFQLKGNPPSRQFIFGTEDGRQVQGFRTLWRDLFTRAGLEPSRAAGLVWHTARHEFISRTVEREDAEVARELARVASLKTVQGYTHARRDRLVAAAAGVKW